MIYLQDHDLIIRNMQQDDAQIFYEIYLSYGWHPSKDTYLNYYKEQIENKRKVFIAIYKGKIAGICTLVLNPDEGPFAGLEIPEIVDLNVFFNMHEHGIGNKLLDIAEAEAKKVSDKVYLAVGLHSGYGPAQRIYIKRGYIPDRTGAWYQGKQLEQYAPCLNDDDLVLFLYKKLK